MDKAAEGDDEPPTETVAEPAAEGETEESTETDAEDTTLGVATSVAIAATDAPDVRDAGGEPTTVTCADCEALLLARVLDDKDGGRVVGAARRER